MKDSCDKFFIQLMKVHLWLKDLIENTRINNTFLINNKYSLSMC